ncbi:MAG TPA: DUF4082 domain-containing protein, partial [Chloroflexota bacterium]|nr:DUF4082 domain-containing protein [Chloroflexota bacterium]
MGPRSGMGAPANTPATQGASRYYRVAGETGTHTGYLWSASGTLLGCVSFSGETSSGWQSANFSAPIAITPHTTYVASVNSNTTLAYTASSLSSSVSNGARATVADGQNGVYSSTAGSFPTLSNNSANYFRDVFFQPQ